MDFFERMLEFFPDARDEYAEHVKKYDEILETVIMEDVFAPRILKMLKDEKDSKQIENVFKYIEETVSGNNFHLINVLEITLLEILGNYTTILGKALKYMGPKTKALQRKADEALGR
ncbi:MAG: resolvase [Lachnospiraceae bacterium]|nr:resolvase [Lachnospiraceae bacterium]